MSKCCTPGTCWFEAHEIYEATEMLETRAATLKDKVSRDWLRRLRVVIKELRMLEEEL